MLTRIISAAVGIVIAVVILIFHDTQYVLSAAVAVLSALAVYEVLRAAKCTDMKITLGLSVAYAVLEPFWLMTRYSYMVTVIFVILMFCGFIMKHKYYEYGKVFFSLAAALLITNAMCTLITLHEIGGRNNIMYLILGLCGAWLADSGAYFVGTFMGKKKLCPEISPKKTVEGFIGGILITGFLFVLISFIYTKVVSFDVSINWFAVCILGMLLSVIGTVGDLSASMLKRQCGIKDYGNIMPGHGGIMDRFDSVLFVAPTMLAFVSIFKIYK